MSFILKPNNRKSRSGSTLKAKIVSPDHKDFIYKEYPILIREQTLTDQECVIRDSNQLSAILDQANPDWANITSAVEELSTALQSATNGSTVDAPEFSVQNIGTTEIISSGGLVSNRPKYKSSNTTDSDFHTTMSIRVHKGSASEIVQRQITVPAYRAEDVLTNLIAEGFSNDFLWNFIRGANPANEHYIGSGTTLADPTTETNLNSILSTLHIEKYVDTSDENAIPTLSVTYPNYYTTPLVTGNKTVATITASEMYQKTNTAGLDIQPVYDNNSSNIANLISNYNTSNIREIVIAYTMQSTTASNNEIVANWSLGNIDNGFSAKVDNIKFMSSIIPFSSVKGNVDDALTLQWVDDISILNDYSISAAQQITKIPEGTGYTISVSSGQNAIVRIPNNLSTYAFSGIPDKNNIGYKYEGGNLLGFSNNLTSIDVSVQNSDFIVDGTTYHGMYLIDGASTSVSVNSTIDVTGLESSIVSEVRGSEPTYGSRYLVLSYDKLPTSNDLIVNFTMHYKNSFLTGSPADTTIKITFTKS